MFHYYESERRKVMPKTEDIKIKKGQQKHHFDAVTIKKTGKGAAIAATGAAALYLLEFLGQINVGVWTPIIAAGVPIITNMIREWMKGE